MTEITGNTSKVYIANNDSTLIAQATKAVCILLPGSFTVAGFNDRGEVLVIDNFEETGKPWEPGYLQQQFQNKSLQNILKKVTAVFIGYDKQLLVPKILYNQAEAEEWMRKLYFVEADEAILHTKLRDEKTYMLHSAHINLTYLLENKFSRAKLLPLTAYQFHRYPPKNLIHCCITEKEVYATCYLDKTLCWHQVFRYQAAEDIVYQFQLLLEEHGVPAESAELKCTAASNTLGHIIEGLKSWYPGLKDGETGNEWKGFVYLLQQLYSCA